ncbi:MAG: hypothetical protein KC910_21680, partial [Candidatus Eremiobacteraeota bacterium]|nr:hypothetical protein [Candidatus Eremiobacteraeota bacterium]
VRQTVDGLQAAASHYHARAAAGLGRTLAKTGRWTDSQRLENFGHRVDEGCQRLAERTRNGMTQGLDQAVSDRWHEYKTNGSYAVSRDLARVATEVGTLVVGPETLLGKAGSAGRAAEGLSDLGRAARFEVRAAGFARDGQWGRYANEAVQGLCAEMKAGQAPAGVESALGRLADSPLSNGKSLREYRGSLGDQTDSLQFYATRTRDNLHTPVRGRYAEAGPPGLPSVAERTQTLLAKGEVPGLHLMTGTIGERTIELTRTVDRGAKGAVWHHTPLGNPSTRGQIMDHLDSLYRKSLDPKLGLDQTVASVGEMHWWLAQAMPLERGSASLSDMLARSIFDARGIETGPWKRGVLPDLEAFVTEQGDFAKGYGQLFESAPRWQ